MNMYQVRALFVRNQRRLNAQLRFDCAWEYFNNRWMELSYYERVLTGQRLARPGPHCHCLPTCIKL